MIARHRNFNAPKICKITVPSLKSTGAGLYGHSTLSLPLSSLSLSLSRSLSLFPSSPACVSAADTSAKAIRETEIETSVFSRKVLNRDAIFFFGFLRNWNFTYDQTPDRRPCSARHWEKMIIKVENNSLDLTRIIKDSWWWRWRRNVSFSLSASLSLFSALTLSSHAHLWSLKLS